MSIRQQWSVFHVERHRGKSIFRHGQQRVHAIPAGFMDGLTEVRVFRNGELFDEGIVEEMGGHDGSLRFAKLDKVVPKEEKWYVSSTSTGVTDPLRPAWFQVGDVIRIRAASQRLRIRIQVWPENWK